MSFCLSFSLVSPSRFSLLICCLTKQLSSTSSTKIDYLQDKEMKIFYFSLLKGGSFIKDVTQRNCQLSLY